MNREQLRQTIVAGVTRLLSIRFVPKDSKKLLRAELLFWQQDDGTALDKLLAIYQQQERE